MQRANNFSANIYSYAKTKLNYLKKCKNETKLCCEKDVSSRFIYNMYFCK